jgi:hypothetical protein
MKSRLPFRKRQRETVTSREDEERDDQHAGDRDQSNELLSGMRSTDSR